MTRNTYLTAFCIATIISLLGLIVPLPIFAVDVPDFPSCPNPGGTLRVQYDSGLHGIAGNTDTFLGSDKVYTLDTERTTQCFCATDNSGIQTNWWKVSSLTEDQKNELISQGWILIPTGAVWGLDDAEYLAKNANFSCSGQNNGSNSGSNNSNSSSGGGSVLGASIDPGQVLGLANTGNSVEILSLLVLSLFSLGLSYRLYRSK